MVVSFQMDASVDKEEWHEILVGTLEFLGLFARFGQAEVDLAFILGKREEGCR